MVVSILEKSRTCILGRIHGPKVWWKKEDNKPKVNKHLEGLFYISDLHCHLAVLLLTQDASTPPRMCLASECWCTLLIREGAHILSLQVCNSAWFLTDCTFDLGCPHSLWVWSFALLLAYISNLLFYVLSYTLCHVSNSKLFTVFTVLPPWDILAFTRGKQPGPLCL